MRAKNTVDGKPSSVIDIRFGLEQGIEYGKELSALLDGQENVSTLLAKILQVEAYDTAYGIADYDGANVSGLDYVKMHPAESLNNDSLLYDAIRKFGKRNIAKTFGLSITEFLDLPRDIAEMVMSAALEVAKDKNEALNTVVDNLNET
tara:strand:- start:388 stop:831 length:444 start_codon:yes stop_codon:yes gene_type:complete